jgi:hypothetical protein
MTALPAVPPLRPRRLWVTLLLMLVIFVSGLGLGSAGTLLFVRKTILNMIHHPEQAAPQIAVRLGSRFGWSPGQVAQVEGIIRARQKELRAIRIEVEPRVLAQLKQLENEIAAVLDERQQIAWHAACLQQARLWIPELEHFESSETAKQP